MEQDREINQVLMNIRGTTGSVISASLFSARITFQLLVFLMRLAKKGLVAAGFCDNFKKFMKDTEGKYTVYNIPVTADRAEKMKQMNGLELKLQNARNPKEKAELRREIKKLQEEIPELEQMQKLGIHHCMLPKLNGSEQTIQIAVAKESDQMFRNWFLNHLTTGLSGGEKSMEDINVFTEGNYTIFNMPFEGEELKTALEDFDVLGMNYACLPDLKVGDGNSQIAVPNADRGKLETWFTMWRDKQLREGKEPGEMYAMDQESYLATGSMEEKNYVASADQEYRDANAEFEAQAKEVPWSAVLQKENSEEYVRLLQDKNFEKITINRETLVENLAVSAKMEEMKRRGYFISRVPGTYNEMQETLILHVDQVFAADDGRTYLAFLPKNKEVMVADAAGNISKRGFQEVYRIYDKVERCFKRIENLKKGMAPGKSAVLPQVSTPVPHMPKL